MLDDPATGLTIFNLHILKSKKFKYYIEVACQFLTVNQWEMINLCINKREYMFHLLDILQKHY